MEFVDFSKNFSQNFTFKFPTTETHFELIYGILLKIYQITLGILMIFGVSGNFWVITRISGLLCRSAVVSGSKVTYRPPVNHIYIYILCLCVVDLFVLSVIPFLLVDQHYGWLFGTVLCKYYYTTESLNKLMSIMILTALSFDRYLAVCHMWKWNWIHTPRFVLCVVGLCAVLALLLLMPLILTADVSIWPLGDGEVVRKCAVDLLIDDRLFTIFVTYIFIICYCTPAILITLFYSRVLLFIRGRTLHTMVSTHIPFKSLTRSVLRVVVFYFLCWSPYWIFMLIICYRYRVSGTGEMPPNSFVVISLYIHGLPYLNSAGNWIFYALFNRDLLQAVTSRNRNPEQSTTIGPGRRLFSGVPRPGSRPGSICAPEVQVNQALLDVIDVNNVNSCSCSGDEQFDEAFEEFLRCEKETYL